jgi:hypothetical protein
MLSATGYLNSRVPIEHPYWLRLDTNGLGGRKATLLALAVLEQAVIKDNTLMPGEWYGGQLHVSPPTDQGGAQKSYTLVITVGPDRHVVDISQGPAGS